MLPLIARIGALALLATTCLRAADRPNILWITSEDNASHWLGCYGNTQAQTPRLDALAGEGIRFTHAYSNAAVCAVARCTILNGAYAPTQGTQHMRSRHPIPAFYQPYVSYLREAGYYCTNNSKTDYNFKGNDKAIWDECSNKAHYRNRPEGKPFFAIFNLEISHESSLFDDGKAKAYHGAAAKQPRIAPTDVTVPPYLPDLPEIRKDIAIYHDIITALDAQVGNLLDELQAAGLAEDTIIFYYSDHGGILPRGKRYLHDTGVRVPLIIRVPEKWAKLAPWGKGSTCDENVAFVDFAPTLLSIIGLDTPPQMQGRAFLGSKRASVEPGLLVYLYADRFDELYGMRRGITNGRWKYIRHFAPSQPTAPYSFYQFGQPGWRAWRQAFQAGKLQPQHAALWQTPAGCEELYDTENDPWEIHNLAGDPQYHKQLADWRKLLRQLMIARLDTGVVPEPMFDLAAGKPIAEYLAARRNDLPALVDLAMLASSADPKALPELQTKLQSPDALTRYWAAFGCLQLGKTAQTAADNLLALLADEHAAIRITAAESLHLLGKSEGKRQLLSELDKPASSQTHLLTLNALRHIGATNEIPAATLQKLQGLGKDGDEGGYIKRTLAEKL
ncbi:MAG TPA: sulfatase [Luteolibacter sp.]|nr:sulfatase [Luteolibacter sp.]